jgi:5-deoxy-glucuronate isomerase
MGDLITDFRAGFKPGFTEVTRAETDATGISFGVLKLGGGASHCIETSGETALLLMSGAVRIQAGKRGEAFQRRSLFDEGPSCLHAPKDVRIDISAAEESELTVYGTRNGLAFEPRFYRPGDVPDEHRGKGHVGDACHRLVRTIFDRRNADPKAELVLGEVITLPGRWSSYPPHHHAQPEIYHYRFTLSQGYGHAELGERVFQVRQYDTLRIPAGLDHAQCAAPGYGMYYSWVIRHLPDRPYTVPEFTAEHRWTMEPEARFWQPKGTGR